MLKELGRALWRRTTNVFDDFHSRSLTWHHWSIRSVPAAVDFVALSSTAAGKSAMTIVDMAGLSTWSVTALRASRWMSCSSARQERLGVTHPMPPSTRVLMGLSCSTVVITCHLVTQFRSHVYRGDVTLFLVVV